MLSRGGCRAANGWQLTAFDVFFVHAAQRAETVSPGLGGRRHGGWWSVWRPRGGACFIQQDPLWLWWLQFAPVPSVPTPKQSKLSEAKQHQHEPPSSIAHPTCKQAKHAGRARQTPRPGALFVHGRRPKRVARARNGWCQRTTAPCVGAAPPSTLQPSDGPGPDVSGRRCQLSFHGPRPSTRCGALSIPDQGISIAVGAVLGQIINRHRGRTAVRIKAPGAEGRSQEGRL